MGSFDTLDHAHLRELLRQRVRDGVLLRLIDKWLQAGVLEDGTLTYPEAGTPQGGVITPPTILQNAPVGAIYKRGGTHPVHDPYLLLIDLHPFHQRTHDLSTCGP